jgi:hypothetical protein
MNTFTSIREETGFVNVLVEGDLIPGQRRKAARDLRHQDGEEATRSNFPRVEARFP